MDNQTQNDYQSVQHLFIGVLNRMPDPEMGESGEDFIRKLIPTDFFKDLEEIAAIARETHLYQAEKTSRDIYIQSILDEKMSPLSQIATALGRLMFQWNKSKSYLEKQVQLVCLAPVVMHFYNLHKV